MIVVCAVSTCIGGARPADESRLVSVVGCDSSVPWRERVWLLGLVEDVSEEDD
jgi:hypothetical protein